MADYRLLQTAQRLEHPRKVVSDLHGQVPHGLETVDVEVFDVGQ